VVEGDVGRMGEAPTLQWPPPGLERMQGDLGSVASRGALAGVLLVLPMLFVVAREPGFATLGPFADAWWVTIVLTSGGLAFALDALARTARLLRRTAHALARGYDLGTVTQVAADLRHDMGFLLQGARHFVVMDERERSAIVQIRVFSIALHALAGLWMALALSFGLLAAARGWLTPMGLWVSTLFPASVAYVFGGVGLLIHDTRVRRARRLFHTQPWSRDLAGEEVAAWQAARAGVESAWPGTSSPRPFSRRALTGVATLVMALGLVVALPVLTLLPTSVMGPVLSTLATPSFDRARRRAAVAEGLRAYTAPIDSTVTPEEAGRLLHRLAGVGLEPRDLPGEVPAPTSTELPWIPDTGGANPTGLDPSSWPDSLMGVVAAGTTGAQRAYLAEVAAHPMRADFARLAAAGDVDVAAARWENPFPAGVSIATIPRPRLTGRRQGVNAHVGAAAYELALGRTGRAEAMLLEIVSVGFLLGDHGPTLLDNLVGFALVEAGGQALEDLYSSTERTAALRELRRAREAAIRAGARVQIGIARSTEAWVRSLPEAVLDTTMVRGLRWEYLISVTSLTPCLNLHRMVFGPGGEYDNFVREAHASLVRFPSEEGLFTLARGGWLGTLQSDEPTLIGRVLSVSMRRGEGACGEAIRRLQAGEVM
jgi:hypothetical protein